MSGMEIVGIYTDTVPFIGNGSPSGPSLGIDRIYNGARM
jgi:hypothetical protein